MQLTKQQIPTPALLLDLDLFETNLHRMADAVRLAGKNLRPHAKAHKCVAVAKRQMAAGALGVCVATVTEAELMTAAGIEGVLLTSPLADPLKIGRLVATQSMAAVDHPQQVEWFQQAAEEVNSRISILIDLDCGDHRTGVPSLESAIDLALLIDRCSHLWLRGIQVYSVSGSHGPDIAARRANSEETFAFAAAVRDQFWKHGLHTDILSGGSTGTWDVDLAINAVTELQAGTYPFMDIAYRNIGIDFEPALSVLATVVSSNHREFVTVDAGFKAFATDRPFGPRPRLPHSQYRWGGDEFGFIDGATLKLGTRIEFDPPHCDPTMNLYDRLYACRGNDVEEVWPLKT